MAAQALYLKYRPQTFDEVVGQAPITRTLQNALRQGRLRHAYLFCGPRGTGKTTMARLLAKAVNCLAPEDERPCNACTLCVALNQGRLLDLIEIDAASNRGIDEIRDIREKVGFRPNEGRYKIYVLDEAHMLTEPAFNALLKTLEEPPPHVIFALVTTDPQKIPATITSRCQRFDFRRVAIGDMVERLRYIAEQEGLHVEEQAFELMAHHSTGALRDAISLLDQMTSYGDEITLKQVQMVLGTVAGEAASALVASLADGDTAAGLDVINRNVADGADPRQFAREVVGYLRGLLLIKEGAGTRLLNATSEQAAEMEAAAGRMPAGRLLRAIRLFNEAATDLRRGFQSIPQLPLEMALVESLHEDEAPPAAQGSPVASKPASPAPSTKPVASGTQSTASAAQSLAPTAQSPAPTAQSPAPAAQQQAPAAHRVAEALPDDLTLEKMNAAWDRVLQAVRERNLTAEAVLRTGCHPVEVNGNEVVVTFPYPILGEKLAHPERHIEIQEALSEVVGARCRVKLVLATEYRPRQAPAVREAPAAQGGTADASGAESTPERQGAPDPAAGESADDTEDNAGFDPHDLSRLSEWAEERGGRVVY
ncbi:MAG: DNA polymerase III subunit gamma/tau [Anaerolineae bacterium]|jgi:DNA polymerase-3 subunit gamma/tau